MFHFFFAVWLSFPLGRHLSSLNSNCNSTHRLSQPLSGFLFEHSFISRFRTFLLSFVAAVFVVAVALAVRLRNPTQKEEQEMNNGNKLNKLGKKHFFKVPPETRETRDNSLPASSFSLLLCNQISTTIQFHKLCSLCCRWKGNHHKTTREPNKAENVVVSNLSSLWKVERVELREANDAEGEQNDD